jgi:aspartyl-tRNA synthetase
MLITCNEKPDIIELEKTEKLIVSSTYEMVKSKYEIGPNAYRSIKVKVYNNFFVVILMDQRGKTIDMAFSDTCDFSVA